MRFDAAPVFYEAILLEPKGSSAMSTPPDQRPLMVVPHGGPHSVIPAAYYGYYAAFVSLGYAVVLVNYRGSIAFGQAGIESLLGRVGVQDVGDVNTAATRVLAEGRADPGRVCCFGGSHGGLIVAHLTGQVRAHGGRTVPTAVPPHLTRGAVPPALQGVRDAQPGHQHPGHGPVRSFPSVHIRDCSSPWSSTG